MGLRFRYVCNNTGWQKTECTVSIVKFPAGEMHIALGDLHASAQVAVLRGADSDDLLAMAMWAEACREYGRKAYAIIPYLPGARADRGVPLGARVYANLINLMDLAGVVSFDVHSDVMPALIKNFTRVDLDESERFTWPSKIAGVIVPDLGAVKRAEIVARRLRVPLFQAKKHRHFTTGKLSGFTCDPVPKEGNLLVVDDICDGGGTFLGLADVLKVDKDRLSLWVSHGIFSNNALDKLHDYYGQIHTTDSIDQPYQPDWLSIHPITDSLFSYLR